MRPVASFTRASDIASEYRRKLRTADEAAQVVKSGDRVHIGSDGSVVRDFEAALARRASELKDVTIISTNYNLPESYKTVEADPNGEHFRFLSTHMSKKDRVINKMGNMWFAPNLFTQGDKLWKEFGNLNVAVIMTAPMDKHGNFNMGVTVVEANGQIDNADILIVEVNRQMPRVNGAANTLNLSQVDYIIEADYPLPELPVREAGGADAKIAEHILPLIESGSCLQLGIGAMPNHLGALIAKSDLNNFSVHTEMLCDSFVDLYEAGKITGAKKTNPGKMVFTFALGTKKLYDFVDENPICYIAPVSYTNNVEVIGSNDKVVSINSCLQIDLYGQVNSESVRHLHISGTGGQVDFVLGSFRSKGGKSFICTPSTKTLKDGTRESLILPFMPPGSIVTCPRAAVDYLVTEYGVANMRELSTWERAEKIINLAHPDYREDLIKDAEKQGIWRNTSKLL